MRTHIALLRFIGRALLQSAGASLVGDFVADVLPEVARDVWAWWSMDYDETQRRGEVEGLICAPEAHIRQVATDLAAELAADRPPVVRAALATYLTQVPAAMRHSFKRPADPTGTTLPANLCLKKADHLLPFLPPRLPRFRPGDHPLPGVDWELDELLGVGGFGEVWKAHNPHLSSARSVALKFCLDPASAQVLRTGRHGFGHDGSGLPQRITNSIGMALVLIPSGTFWMGSAVTEAERGQDEGPQHQVTITQPFYMGIHPVTQQQYEAVMGSNPAYFNGFKGGGAHHPVERISWHEAVDFCRKLSAAPEEKKAGRVYRLPTEAEWEYACRAGTSTPFAFGAALSAQHANFNGNYPYGGARRGRYLEMTSRVGSYAANDWGLHDMHGNVWEWCSDYYTANYYRNSPRQDPQGPEKGIYRVLRGGSSCNIARFCRSAYRLGISPDSRDHDVGMRTVMTLAAHQPE